MKLSVTISALSTLLLLAGCHSYRVAGNVKDSSGPSVQVNGRYYLREIKFDVQIPQHPIYGGPMANPQVPVQVASQMDDIVLREYCEKQWPGIFSSSKDTIAVDVIITARRPKDSYAWTFFFPYFLTLGILPGGVKVESYARLNVKVNERHLASGEANYVVNRKVSAFSPLGVIPFSRGCGYPYVEATEEVSFPANPRTVEKMGETVFCKTFAETVLKCLYEYERNNARPAAEPIRSKPLSSSIENLKKLRADGVVTEKEYQDMVMRIVEKR